MSVAEYEWDGDPSRGTGDYRIPDSLTIDANGDQITQDKKFPNKGTIQ